MTLPPFQLISDSSQWQECLARLQQQPRLAIDLESNSMYVYHERVCLIQISIPGQDYIIDPQAGLDLSGLGTIVADPQVEKIFHAAEYDLILLEKEYDWRLHNLFDTMWAVRVLGHNRVGLASVLEELYDIKLDKRYQRANWCQRPLTQGQLAYAQRDTHYLLRLRDELARRLVAAGRMEEAQEIFSENSRSRIPDTTFDPESFWSLRQARKLPLANAAILRALNIYRDQEARKKDRPLFKIIGNNTLVDLARAAPTDMRALSQIGGMTNGQIRRYGQALLRIIEESRSDPPPKKPRPPKRTADDVWQRYERLQSWRKERAQARGVESDVIISRDAMWAIAHAGPTTLSDLAAAEALGPWRQAEYGSEILQLINNVQ